MRIKSKYKEIVLSFINLTMTSKFILFFNFIFSPVKYILDNYYRYIVWIINFSVSIFNFKIGLFIDE